MEQKLTRQLDASQKIVHPKTLVEDGVRCPICQLFAGRLIRGKVYCCNCGFIES